MCISLDEVPQVSAYLVSSRKVLNTMVNRCIFAKDCTQFLTYLLLKIDSFFVNLNIT